MFRQSGIFGAPNSSRRSSSHGRLKARPALEALEGRVVLSTIKWTNEGNDGFATVFGDQAAYARSVVHTAINEWQ